MKKLPVLLLVTATILAGCTTTTPEPEVSPEIIGEWESDEFISSGITGEIDGRTYLFLMTFATMPFKPTLRVLDLHDPSSPLEMATLKAPVDSWMPVGMFKLSGNILYIPIGGPTEGELWAVDVSQPASPQEISLLDLRYAAIDMVLYDSIAYIGDFAYQLFSIIDVADPARMQPLGEFQLSRHKEVLYHSRGMDVSGSLLYVVDRDGLDIIDVSPPSLPREVGFYANPMWTGEELELEGGPQQESITKISGMEDILPDGFQSVVASGQQVYIPAGTSGLRVLDVSDPVSPQDVAQLDIPEFAYQATIADNLLYLLGVEMIDRSILHTIYIIDVAEPENPVIAASVKDIWGMPPYQSGIAAGKYIYFINLRTVQVIDVYASDEGK